MSQPRSNFQTSSPSFPSVEQVSGDIFFQVKKQILDKLDIILQKVNLQVIEYLKPQGERKDERKAFRFIELSSFEKQIQTLFDYLDRLYESLNSSISFSSNDIKNTLNNTESNKSKTQSINPPYNSILVSQINEMKTKFEQLGEETLKLREQNEHMKFLIKNNLSNSEMSLPQSVGRSSKSSFKSSQKQPQSKEAYQSPQQQVSFQSSEVKMKQSARVAEGISLETVKKILRFYNHSIRQLAVEYKESIKGIKKTLKQVKFQFIQNRVECIAQLKKWSQKYQVQNQLERSQTSTQKQADKRNKASSKKSNSSVVEQLTPYVQAQETCSQDCLQKHYRDGEEKNGFQEDLLQKIQQILDVC